YNTFFAHPAAARTHGVELSQRPVAPCQGRTTLDIDVAWRAPLGLSPGELEPQAAPELRDNDSEPARRRRTGSRPQSERPAECWRDAASTRGSRTPSCRWVGVHGARSMEAVIEMSALSGRARFTRSALPAAHQLALHVDADEFLGLGERNPGA